MATTLLRKEHGLNLKETELCLGLPGGGSDVEIPRVNGKRGFSETVDLKLNLPSKEELNENLKNVLKEKTLLKDPAKPPAKAQVVGWPPVRSYRKNLMTQKVSNEDCSEKIGCGAFVKVSMDGAPYLRKVDLTMYKCYQELADALAKMFSSFTTAPRAMEKCKRRS
ncbi:hypothetical protein TanjilG_08363 [Lupinus angustifolius]|uniref:Auxin-induced protein n=1 Tax=Lupinus angustifolius TaxID=3871 RepID=A0A1J7H307_LUPAN|nr:hypothetical protein TanjilG_08363 [Lupinus angustifolius]